MPLTGIGNAEEEIGGQSQMADLRALSMRCWQAMPKGMTAEKLAGGLVLEILTLWYADVTTVM